MPNTRKFWLMVFPLLALLIAACTGAAGPIGPPGPAGPAGTGVTPKDQHLKIVMGEGEIIQEVEGKETLTGEFHRWEPAVLVVNKGDTVHLTVENPRGNAHSLTLPDFGVTTPLLEARGGIAEVVFVADKAGTFQFKCGSEYDGALGICDVDHKRMVGNLIVLER